MRHWPLLKVLLLITIASSEFSSAIAAELNAVSQQAIVSTGHPLATDVAIQVMEDGGNAIDAAVAAALTLGVVKSSGSGLGGGCFIIARTEDGEFIAIDGRETAPAKATRDMYLDKDGKAISQASQTGPLAVGTPGALAAYELLLKQAGRKSIAALLQRPAEIAADGFPLSEAEAQAMKILTPTFKRFPGSRVVYLKPDGSHYRPGETFKQPDLAETYRKIASNGSEWFYRGPFAKNVGAWMQQNGGILSTQDFSSYKPGVRKPLMTTYRDYQIVGFPPPSSGGVHIAQILNILEPFNLKAMHAKSPAQFTHTVTEAMRLAFADRAYWLGDPAFAKVPSGLASKSYAKRLSARIKQNKVLTDIKHGLPPGWNQQHFGGDNTTHISAADANGNWVAITATINTLFGSKLIVPGTGLILNNEMDDFSVTPGVPNAFGLIGAQANAIEPGKRMLSSCSPTMVMHDDEPILAVGAAGGPRIITSTLLTIIRRLDLQQSLEQAVQQPRFHHQWWPEELNLETGFSPDQKRQLKSLGHKIGPARTARVHAVGRTDDGKMLTGVADPRAHGKAAGMQQQ